MNCRREIGTEGEKIAADYLEQLGYEILVQNWRHKHLEVDIIAKDGACLLFVEVKVRKSKVFGEEHRLLSKRQQTALTRAANAYIVENNFDGQIRFDLISIIDDKLTYIKDAFWNY